MNKEHFQLLLEDLYDKYNHTKKSEVPMLVEKYNGQEFDAIKTFYFKYNFRSNSNYDPKAGTDHQIKILIESYSKGERIIKHSKQEPTAEEESLATIRKEAENANSTISSVSESKKEELLKIAEEKTNLIQKIINEKEKYFQSLINKLDEVIQEKTKKLNEINEKVISDITQTKNDSDEHIEIKINLDFEETDIELPKEVNTMAAGTRFLIPSPGGKLLAFEIKDIFCDYVTIPGKCLKEINIQRL